MTNKENNPESEEWADALLAEAGLDLPEVEIDDTMDAIYELITGELDFED